MMMIPIVALCCARALTGDGWVHIDAVRATGFERVAEGDPHPFTIVRSKGDFAITCSRDIDGALSGVLRTEVGNEDGVFTWIAGNPRFVLRLDGSSAPEWIQSLLPSSLSPSALKSESGTFQKTIDKRVTDEGEDEVASRDCFVVGLSDDTPLVQNLWVDQKTGMVLRQLDSVANHVVYERRLSSYEPDPVITASSFSLPSGAVVIQGIVSPQILTEASMPHSSSQYDVDLGATRSSSPYDQGKWILKALTPPNYSYMGTSAADLGMPLDLTLDYSSDQGTRGPALPSFGGIPEGWTDPGQVVLSGDRIYFGFPSMPTMAARGVLSANAIDNGANTMVQPIAYMGPDGTIYRTQSKSPTGNDQTAPVNPLTPNTGVKEELMVRSEFLDQKTGDTTTFVQLRNLPMKTIFPGIRLPGPEPIISSTLEDLNGYNIAGPVPMKAVQWRGKDDTEYVLVSTSLDFADLQKIAERAD